VVRFREALIGREWRWRVEMESGEYIEDVRGDESTESIGGQKWWKRGQQQREEAHISMSDIGRSIAS
jgi:hypothetical protein